LGVVGIAEDITERVRLEERLRQAQKMEAVGKLAGGVAHDFNNLLTVISNAVSLLEARRCAGDGELLELIHSATERAAALTSQLLAFSRKQVMQRSPVDLNQVVSAYCALLSRIVGEQVTLRTELSDAPAIAEADPNFIEQVLMNLVVNARDAMPHGGTITLRVENVVADCPPGASCTTAPFVRVSVRDTGTGIRSEDVAHIFEPFYSTKEQGKGTGLGLATVHGIVQQHGGRVDLETELGRGSTFYVYLPRVAGVPSAPRKPVFEAPRGNETILLVEDEQAVRQTVRAALEGCGYTVHEAPDGDSALEIWHRYAGRFDLLLTDIVMPGSLSGVQLAERLRARRASLPIIYMSGYSGHDIPQDPWSTLVPKPFQLPVLARIVREKLDAVPARSRVNAAPSLESRTSE
jgi:nitrogen-specific signal transduction histidine kinase/CheY-like chemotaxis protein